MEGIKEAFNKVKDDINYLKSEIFNLNNNLLKTKENFSDICNVVSIINKKNSYLELENIQINEKIDNILNKLDVLLINTSIKKTNSDTILDKSLDNSTHISTGNGDVETNIYADKTIDLDIKTTKDEKCNISTGNRGVQTDRQTDRQTDIECKKGSYNHKKIEQNNFNNKLKVTSGSIDSAVEMLDSLDSIKREIRLKFKRLTEQEILVFSTIYQLEEEFGYSDYKSIAKKINLTESSIRDYIRRLINKGIPIIKNRINNKEIRLSISQNLRRIATLNTILELRDI
jgi:DNA-binding MarR family transcriptional regulator